MPPATHTPEGRLPEEQPASQSQQVYTPEPPPSEPIKNHTKKWIVFLICFLLIIGACSYVINKYTLKETPESTATGTQEAQAGTNIPQFETKRLTNGGYTYSFRFYKQSSLIQPKANSYAYKYLNDVIAGVQPSASPALNNCSQIGSQWQEAFSVEVNKKEYKVCSPSPNLYSMYFSALNQNHLFTVTFRQNQTVTVYTTLKDIFGSVQVSK